MNRVTGCHGRMVSRFNKEQLLTSWHAPVLGWEMGMRASAIRECKRQSCQPLGITGFAVLMRCNVIYPSVPRMCLQDRITNPSCQLWSLSVGKCKAMEQEWGKSQSSEGMQWSWTVGFCAPYLSLDLYLYITFVWACRKLAQLTEPSENASLIARFFLPAQIPEAFSLQAT